MIKQAAKNVAAKAANENLAVNYYGTEPLSGGHYAKERSDNIQNDVIQPLQDDLPTCPSSCRCECILPVFVDKTTRLPRKNYVVSNTVGNDTSQSKEL